MWLASCRRNTPGDILNRRRWNFFADSFLHHAHTRAFVDHDFLPDPADGSIRAFDLGDFLGLTDDCGVVDHHTGRMNPLMKTLHGNKVKKQGRDNNTSGRTRRPTNEPTADAPVNPRRRPFDVRHPEPAHGRVMDPAAIMITGPRPRFVTFPIPAAIRPDPATITVRSPASSNAGRPPATTVTLDLRPRPMRG